MKKLLIVIVAAAALAGAYFAGRARSGSQTTTDAGGFTGAAGAAGARGAGGRGARGGGAGGGQFGRPPMTVEVAKARRESIAAEITVVGNLVGEQTVAVAPRAAGRLQDLFVRLGDRVNRGQRLARIEDFEIQEQVKQAEAAQEVAQATIRQREADLQLAQTNVERSRNLFQRQLLPKQTLDDNEARYQSGLASLDLARAQYSQSKARLDELRINLSNTIITSPVTGFVAKRNVDPGAFVAQNTAIVDVVDITTVRLLASVVERDLKELQRGNPTQVDVDAFPGEHFTGRIARVSPVLDPATRTAPIEIEIPNADFRLKPGMYARVGITTNTRKDALVVPASAVVDLGGRRGVFTPLNESAVFRAITTGTEQMAIVEVLAGLAEGDTVITTGSGALRDGDRIVLPGGLGGERGQFGRGRGGRGQGSSSNPAAAGAAVPGRGEAKADSGEDNEGAAPSHGAATAGSPQEYGRRGVNGDGRSGSSERGRRFGGGGRQGAPPAGQQAPGGGGTAAGSAQ